MPFRPGVFAALAVTAFGILSSQCTTNQGWYDPMTGNRSCAAAPRALDYWSSGMHVRSSGDSANLEAFLTKYPDVVNKQFGASCQTPLHGAARLGREDLARLLIAHRADLRARDKYGDTPLQTAAMSGRANVVTVLLASGADANAIGPREEPPLRKAIAGLPGADDLATRLEVTTLLLAAGADINAKGPDGRTALLSAIGGAPLAYNNDRMIEFLLEHGADVHSRDLQGGGAIGYAAGAGNGKVLKLLLNRGADKDGSGKDAAALGEALSSAAYGGYVDIAALLLERGADVNWRYRGPARVDEWHALPLAAALMVARSADKPAMARRHEVALALIAHGADVNARKESGETLLHDAAADGDLAAIDLLLSHGATVGARDGAGFTPLHRAVQKGHVDAATRLIASGANGRAAAADGTTPLSLADGDPEMEALIHRYAKN